jgi:hypothetical protein
MPVAGPSAFAINTIEGANLAVYRHQVDAQGYSHPPADHRAKNDIFEKKGSHDKKPGVNMITLGRYIKKMKKYPVLTAAWGIMILFNFNLLPAQSGYASQEAFLKSFDYSKRAIPQIPGKGAKIRVIIDTDAKNEIDDLWAVALALLSPDRFEIEGFVAANFDNSGGGPEGIEKSYEELKIL